MIKSLLILVFVQVLMLIGSVGWPLHAATPERSFTQPHQLQYGYAAVVKHGDLLYLSGIAAPGKDMEAQVKHVYSLLKMTLEAHGSSMAYVLNERVSTTDIEALTEANSIRMSFYPDNAFPASSWYQVSRLFHPQALLEVEVVAMLSHTQ